MALFVKNGNTFRVTSNEQLHVCDNLPVGNYVIKTDQFGNMFLEQVDSFEPSTKLYGNTPQQADRILKTFLSREQSTGVMLCGDKGSGKSLLARTVSVDAAKLNIPTIIINSPWNGDAFNTFVQSIDQPAIFLFDEFEKIYTLEEQDKLLTLFDGVFPTKKLFIITCNERWRVNTHLQNRPGRIFYFIEFYGVTEEFITQYCEDNLNNKEHISRICRISGLFGEFNFDMLKALVQEMNRYNEPPELALEYLNIKLDLATEPKYDVLVYKNNQLVPDNQYEPKQWEGNLFIDDKFSRRRDIRNRIVIKLMSSPHINHVTASFSSFEAERIEYEIYNLTLSDIVSSTHNTITLTTKDKNIMVVLTKQVPEKIDYRAF